MSSEASASPLLHGRRVLLTGGAGGWGLAFAEHLAAQGAQVVIADLRADLRAGLRAGLAEQSAAMPRAAGHAVQALALDLGRSGIGPGLRDSGHRAAGRAGRPAERRH